jgi:superfamily II DNA or RNA helicase/HKD family nuclease
LKKRGNEVIMLQQDAFFTSDQLLSSLKTGFVSQKNPSDEKLSPMLLVNDYKRKKKILSSLQEELTDCVAFDFSVAFINHEGLACIKQVLAELARYKVKGRILTTNYLNFTQPSALTELLAFSNIELRAYTKGGFHPKGYIFTHSNYYSMIIGSANLTASALNLNQEWSIKFLSLIDGQIVHSVREEFEYIWNAAECVDENWIAAYQKNYDAKRVSVPIVFENDGEDFGLDRNDDVLEIIPNKMQQEAMISLATLRAKGENRALLIAATGTGKTYLSIFDIQQVKPKTVLYIAHRDMILAKAEKSFCSVFPDIKTGFLNGREKDIEAPYLFASVFTLSKDEILHQFDRTVFDYIIVDEVHHAGADSYKKILEYFTPAFMLGLTATPERTDGFDIFSLFHNNVPYEIRLQQAFEADLLCPFHYYGLTDLTVNGAVVDEKTSFVNLVNDERLRHIEQAMKLYRNFAYPVKGLIFCSRIDEATWLTEKLNNDGICTKFLSGTNSDAEREMVIEALESDTDPLSYIVSVDILNEGVDIPSVNQIVMLRPTQSAIIFVQQLGRGLRKCAGKSYVAVIDFIGNYENNFFIPIALYGDSSFDKDTLRRNLTSGSATLPGCSTIQLNEIARQKIFDSLARANFNQMQLLKNEYLKLKNRLGFIPSMQDFTVHGFIDPLLFIDYAGSYYEFVCKVEHSITDLLPAHRTSLQFISGEFAHGERLHELLILKRLLSQDSITITAFQQELAMYGVPFNKDDVVGMCNTLSSDFYLKSDLEKYGEITYLNYDEKSQTIRKSEGFSRMLLNIEYKKQLEDCLDYGIKRSTLKETEKIIDHNLVLYRTYSRKDVCKLLNWKRNITPQNIGGYIVQKEPELACPIFITYKKSSDIADSINYEDFFIDTTRLQWMSKNKRTSSSPDVQAIINQQTNNILLPLFVKKDDNDGTDFYYLGNMHHVSFEDTTMKNDDADISVVRMQFDLLSALPQELFRYLIN